MQYEQQYLRAQGNRAVLPAKDKLVSYKFIIYKIGA